MGRDKAQLIVRGTPLWLRQLGVLGQTDPAEVLISGPADGLFRDAPCRVVLDDQPGQGPLGGIATILGLISSDWLLVLAVDLPFITPEFLRALVVSAADTGRGMVSVHSDGKLEPLVAVYPRAARAIALEQLRLGERKLLRFIERLETAGLIARHVVPPEDARLFANWNTPADFAGDEPGLPLAQP